MRRIRAVIVEDRLDGSMRVRNNGSYFNYREIDPELIRRSNTTKKVRNRARRVYIPPKDHPWKRFKIKTHLPVNNYQQKPKEEILTTRSKRDTSILVKRGHS